MKTHVEFRSEEFGPYVEEESSTNPGRYGKRLAEFLKAGLAKEGFEPGELVAEDWGWIVPVKNDEFKLWIGCGNYEEYPNGFLCFIEPHQPAIRKFLRKISTVEKVTTLQMALDKVLSLHPGIQEKKWWTFEEFNHGTKGEGTE